MRENLRLAAQYLEHGQGLLKPLARSARAARRVQELLTQFDLHAKAGIYFADSRQTVRLRDVESGENIDHTRVDASQTEFFVGIGATWNATENLAVRVEYQKFLENEVTRWAKVGKDNKITPQ